MLRVDNITMLRNKRKVLDIASLTLATDQFTAIIGRNGAGKTSLIKALGLLAPFACSHYVLEGQTRNILSERLVIMRQFAHVFQHSALLRGDVVYNVALPLLLRGVRRGVAEATALNWLRLVQAEHLAKRNPQTLSGGESARVCLARALVTEPKLLFLDEPFAGLDVESQAYILRHLKGWLAQSRTTGVLVTHNYSEVAHLAERLIVMDDGCIIADGAPPYVLARPKTNFLKDFVSIGGHSLHGSS